MRTPAFRARWVCGFTLIELMVVIAILGVLTALLLPAIGRTRTKAQNTVCLSQLRQLGLSVRMYSEDNDGRFPAAELLPSVPVDANHPLPRIADVLGTYAGRSGATNGHSVLKCPGDRQGRFAKEGSSYEWNIELNGRRIDETRAGTVRVVRVVVRDGQPAEVSDEKQDLMFPPTTTPLLLDYDPFHPRPPKPGKNVVYMDGHASGFEVPGS
jgi:prepilin-type N-terminal cleavage/methylation domain-containing protein